jgi:hypothetical protein
MPASPGRVATFLLASTALVALAVALSRHGDRRELAPADRPGERSAPSFDRPASLPAPAVVAVRFANAYFRYEIGALGRPERVQIRSSAAGEFARDLLNTPVRVPPSSATPEVARIRDVTGTDLTLGAAGEPLVVTRLAIVRGGRPDELALQLARRPDGWRVVGLGE